MSNKKMNFPILKTIRISKNQAKRWDPALIRGFLDKIKINKIKENKKGGLNRDKRRENVEISSKPGLISQFSEK